MSNNKIIYFDNAAKTIPYDEVREVFAVTSKDNFANPSSIHALGTRNARQIDLAREKILSLLKLNNHQVLFTSGATEANNLAVKGYALKYKNRGKHLITTIYEHPSILEAFKQLENEFGFEVTYLNPNEQGVITVDNVLSHLKNDTILVSIMAVNNEIGSINPISEIAKELTKFPKIAFHVDAAQAVGKLPKELDYSNVDLLTVSAHKMHGLVGTGALIKKKNLILLPLLSGGGQEYDLRSGTNDIAGILAFLKAMEISISKAKEHYEMVKPLADKLVTFLKENPDLFELNIGELNPYIINFSTKTKKSSVVVEALSNAGIMVSSVSACHSSKERGSYVVKSLGKDDKLANNTVRVSFGYYNTLEEVEEFIVNLKRIIGEIR